MTPDRRAKLVRDRSHNSLDELDDEFRQRVEAKGRELLTERGLLDPEAT